MINCLKLNQFRFQIQETQMVDALKISYKHDMTHVNHSLFETREKMMKQEI